MTTWTVKLLKFLDEFDFFIFFIETQLGITNIISYFE